MATYPPQLIKDEWAYSVCRKMGLYDRTPELLVEIAMTSTDAITYRVTEMPFRNTCYVVFKMED